MIQAFALAGLPEIEPGTDLAAAISTALTLASERILDDDVLVIAHKAISKSEGRLVSMADVVPGQEALRIASQQGKDPRHVQVVLDESRQIVRAGNRVLIVETRHGFVCANAGVDASNVPGDDQLVLLPLDPDASARALRAQLRELTGAAPGIIVTDSFGRAWRTGQCDVAIGCAGVGTVEDWRGAPDTAGREMHATVIAIADELAGAADLARRKDSGEPVVVIRGAERHITAQDGPGVAPLIRARDQDLFR